MAFKRFPSPQTLIYEENNSMRNFTILVIKIPNSFHTKSK
ncbi:hypothetical protein DOY81_003502 [Sarcophaga bullata]|nr:hypothetical protein DOY81_003502 [Sarcophaga bullata]